MSIATPAQPETLRPPTAAEFEFEFEALVADGPKAEVYEPADCGGCGGCGT